MSDKRELVLVRLRELAEQLTDEGGTQQLVKFAGRNSLEVSETKLPAVMVLEGDEEPSPTYSEIRQRSTSPIPMVMTPELCVIANERPEELGETLNEIRAALVKAVTTDANLEQLIGSNGRVVYRGMVSDLGIGRANLGRMALRFAVTYVLKPTEL